MSGMQSAGAPRAGALGWVKATIVGIAGLFYAYAVWNAIAYLIAMAQGSGLTVVGWATLGFGVLFPIIVFVLAFALGRRRGVGELALVMLTGLALIAVFWLSLVGYSILNMNAIVNLEL